MIIQPGSMGKDKKRGYYFALSKSIKIFFDLKLFKGLVRRKDTKNGLITRYLRLRFIESKFRLCDGQWQVLRSHEVLCGGRVNERSEMREAT